MIYTQIADTLEFTPQDPRPEDLEAWMAQAARTVLDAVSMPEEAELTIVLSDDAQLRALNNEFLGIDAPTDVLSFPAGDEDPDTEAEYLGDILISYPRAQAQAVAGGHTVQAELQLLTIHGTLHLLGHDHAETDEKAKMWSIQADILRQLGLPDIAPQD